MEELLVFAVFAVIQGMAAWSAKKKKDAAKRRQAQESQPSNAPAKRPGTRPAYDSHDTYGTPDSQEIEDWDEDEEEEEEYSQPQERAPARPYAKESTELPELPDIIKTLLESMGHESPVAPPVVKESGSKQRPKGAPQAQPVSLSSGSQESQVLLDKSNKTVLPSVIAETSIDRSKKLASAKLQRAKDFKPEPALSHKQLRDRIKWAMILSAPKGARSLQKSGHRKYLGI
jgi:hypothetical protein